MRYCFDIDGTLCTNSYGEYETAQPCREMIDQVNRLYDAGHYILLFTARGTTTGLDWRELTEHQMAAWGVRHHELLLGKPEADAYIDDKGMSLEEWAKYAPNVMPEPCMEQAAERQRHVPPSPETGILSRPDYLTIVYSEQRKPKSAYPAQLARYLEENAFRGKGRLLDIGCGRGDMLKAFAACGFDVAGLDISTATPQLCQPHLTMVADLERDQLPFPPGSFDCVFSKSVIEHVSNPLELLKKARAALRPGGTAVIMTPSWMHHHFGPFYADYTHITPFTAPSLRDVLSFAGFDSIEVRHFRQLPFLWRFPNLRPFVWAFSKLPLPYRPMYDMPWQWPVAFNKLIRFSKEVMLLAIARKAS